MKLLSTLAALAVVCTPCLEWTRLSGVVKNVNLKESTVTILNRDGDLLTIPIDYQVSMTEKHDETRTMKSVRLDEKITFVRTQAAKPLEDDAAGALPPEPPTRGR